MDELSGFLEQSNISRKNIARLEVLAQHESSEVKDLALLILEVARVKTHKRRRWKFLAAKHPELFLRLMLLYGDDFPEDFSFEFLEQDHPELVLRLRALSRDDFPEADLSFSDWDISRRLDLESGRAELLYHAEHEAAPSEYDLYWLGDAED